MNPQEQEQHMNCPNHPDVPAVAYCRTCGKPLCEACRNAVQGTVYCEEHVPAQAAYAASGAPAGPASPGSYASAQPNLPPLDPSYSPYTAPPPPLPAPALSTAASPGLAFVLGLIPGVGAIYNGQYVKGLIHVIVLGVLLSIIGSGAANGWEAMFGLLIAAWWFYMAFEAYHTARKRQLGEQVDEFSSLVPLHRGDARLPAGPVILIAIGVLFLLDTLDIVRFAQLLRYWPVVLIVLGAYMLYERLSGPRMGGQL